MAGPAASHSISKSLTLSSARLFHANMEETAKPEYKGEDLRKEGEDWMARIRAAQKREDTWRKDAEAAEKAYAADTDAKQGKLYDFNILHSNVETIVPAIFNSTPVPDIRRRWIQATAQPPTPPQPQEGQRPDPRAEQAAQAAMQVYQQAQQADKDAKDFGDMLERVISQQIDDNKLDTEIEAVAQDAFLSGRGLIRLKFDADDDGNNITNERILFEAVSWRDYACGPAKRWEDRPWEAFRHCVSRETLELKHIDKEMYASQGPEVAAVTEDSDKDDIAIWEIWCEYDRTVKFVREHDGRVLNKVPDPLGLSSFYSTPPAVQPIKLTNKITPVNPFSVYRKLADELDLCTKRINAITKGLKVRGLVVGSAAQIKELASAGDNEIVTVTELEQLVQTGGLEKAILWWPVEQAIKVLAQLYTQREETKSAIYEITGISDIVRGASNANETLGAQQIKTQWGSLRIQKMQRLIERAVRDIFVMMSEIIPAKFSPQTLQQMTGIQITDGIMALMSQKVAASYRIDVESDSTVRADLTRQKTDMTEFLRGTGEFFGTMGPLIQQAPEMAEPMSEVYSSFSRVFKLGKQAEDALERMSQLAKQAASQPRPPSPEQQKAEADMAAKKQDAEIRVAESQADMQAKQTTAALDMQSKQTELQMKRELAAISVEIKQIELAMKREEMVLKRQEMEMTLQYKQAEAAMRANEQAQPTGNA